MIIPFFIPHAGCSHQCVFCNQKNITGRQVPAGLSALSSTIHEFVRSNTKQGPVHVAFYGGSFTALSWDVQKTYLEAIRPFILSGTIDSIRCSTRPDCISRENLARLKAYHVKTVELGAQSMDDTVLSLAGRGHTAADTRAGVRLLQEGGFCAGLQVMPGLPGDSPARFLDTVDKIIDLKPDFVRIYPALVIKDTPLERLFRSGQYRPLTLECAVTLCRTALLRFELANIEVIRIGLQPTEELDRPGTVLAGPYHPAFRQLVESSLLLDKMRLALRELRPGAGSALFQVHPKDLSSAIGQRSSNIAYLKSEFGLKELRVVGDARMLKRREPTLLSSS